MEKEILTLEEIQEETFIEHKIGVYIEIDGEKRIKRVFSDLFEKPSKLAIKVDEGTGDKYAHAQGNYLDKSLMDEQGCFNYKYEDNKIVERTEEEKKKEIETRPVIKTPLQEAQEKIASLKEELKTTNQYMTDLELMILEKGSVTN